MPVSVRWGLFLDLWKSLPCRSGFNQPGLIKQLFTVRIKHSTEILFKSRRLGCSFCFWYHGMSCKDKSKILQCIQDTSFYCWKWVLLLFFLLPAEFLVDWKFRSDCLCWGGTQGGLEMPTFVADREHQPAPAPRLVLWHRLLPPAVSLKQPLRPCTAALSSTHPPGLLGILFPGFTFLFLIIICRLVGCWRQCMPHCKEETTRVLAFLVCRFPRDDDNVETQSEGCLWWQMAGLGETVNFVASVQIR